MLDLDLMKYLLFCLRMFILYDIFELCIVVVCVNFNNRFINYVLRKQYDL